MTDIQKLPAAKLADQCTKWFRLNRKSRREVGWIELLRSLFTLIFPEVRYDQLLISESEIFEHLQLFFNTCLSSEKTIGELIQENPLTDCLICLQGVIECNTQGIKQQWHPQQIIAFTKHPSLRSQKIYLRVLQRCSYLQLQRKTMQKFKNDLLRQDRQIKERFLSANLFCNFTPVYYLTNVTIIQIAQGRSIDIRTKAIYLLYSGLIRRRARSQRVEGTELTQGCIINSSMVAQALQLPHQFHEDEVYETKANSIIVIFQLQQLSRIIKLNPNLKKLLEAKIRTILIQRQNLSKKSAQIFSKFNQRLRMQQERLQITYSVQFKQRGRTATPLTKSFRKIHPKQGTQQSCGEFITFDRYQKMIDSKQRVALTKHGYVVREKKIQRQGNTAEYERRIKLQNKMMKIQTGKIQKISQRDSKKQCNIQQLQEIKRNLFQVTHLFDQPLQQLDLRPEVAKKSKTFNNLSVAEHRNPRVSNLRPQEYLKNEYFHEFNSRSRTRYSLKQIEQNVESNKQNNTLMDNFIKNGICFARGLGFNTITNQIRF